MTTILAVDDQPDNLELLRQVLEDDFSVITAASGVECLEVAQESQPDMILLDVQMPDMDGYAVLEKLREREDTRTIPVIFITARYRDPDRVARGLELGAFDYIAKPIDDDVLLTKVAVTARIRQAERDTHRAQEQLLHQQRRETERIAVELEKLREELVRKTRLAAIGQVSASIAHELRNPMGAVRNAAYYLRRHAVKDQPKVAQYLQIIDEEVAAADSIIQNLLSMARVKEPQRRKVDLSQVVREAFEAVGHAQSVTLQLSADPDPFVILADPDQLRQVVWNLMANAQQAVDGQGEIAIQATRGPDADTIVFRDTGPGVPRDIQSTLFEPLVSARVKGTGMGLTVCRTIVEHHGGTIELQDTGESGAAFRIRLPRG